MSYRCNSLSPIVKVTEKRQKSVMKDFEIFPRGNGSVRFTVTLLEMNSSNLSIAETTYCWCCAISS